MEVKTGEIKCDFCDFSDMSVPIWEFSKWLDKPCPQCGKNLLTKEDYKSILVLLGISYTTSLAPKSDKDFDLGKTITVEMGVHKGKMLIDKIENTEESKSDKHDLKTWPEYFNEIFLGHKTFEVRKNDRDFKVGDYLILKEWDQNTNSYTGRMMVRKVSYIFKGGEFGVKDGYVVMSIG